jgi:hypothetical protein
MANERPEHSSEFLIGEADFAGATFAEKANFRIAVFPEKADFAGATFTSDALFAYATCEPGTKRMILTTRIAYGPRSDSVIGEKGTGRVLPETVQAIRRSNSQPYRWYWGAPTRLKFGPGKKSRDEVLRNFISRILEHSGSVEATVVPATSPLRPLQGPRTVHRCAVRAFARLYGTSPSLPAPTWYPTSG